MSDQEFLASYWVQNGVIWEAFFKGKIGAEGREKALAALRLRLHRIGKAAA